MTSVVRRGFTIVELLIVVVVIAILAAITVVSYNGITGQAKDSVVKSDLSTAAKKLQITKVESGSFPANTDGIPSSSGVTFAPLQRTASTFCLQATNADGKVFFVTENSAPKEGQCPPAPFIAGANIQTATTANCPTTRTLAVDARDSNTYWIQKMPDDKCWMLTNLAYAGGGTNTYSDTKSITLSSSGTSYTEPRYYTHANANPTTNPALPSINNTGGGTAAGGERQYGYLYNWCAAMGVQTTTSACANADTPPPDTSVSVCPANWRLPTGEPTTGEFQLLANSIGATSNAAGSTALRASWLAQRGGGWGSDGFLNQGSTGSYWSATQNSATHARNLYFSSSAVNPSNYYNKNFGFSVRCVAS